MQPEDVVRADLKRLQADRDELCAELAGIQREYDNLLAEIAAGHQVIEELRSFEREYRRRLQAWVDTALSLISPDKAAGY